MDRRVTVGGNVTAVMTAQNASPESVAEATHLDLSELDARLNDVEPFTLSELITVGGFLHVPPASFLEGVPA